MVLYAQITKTTYICKKKKVKTYPNCKINLGLNIVEKRPDGYHNIETIFYPVPLSDEIEISESELDSLETKGISVECEPESNLVFRVLTLLRGKGYHIPNIKITLTKNIPNGAGLGGGSSDAAFMTKILNDQFSLGIKDFEMEQMLSNLGADCPVFIKNKPVYAEGIGNIFSDIEVDLKGWHLTIVKPDVFVSTRDAYASVKPKYPEVNLCKIASKPLETWREYMINDFEESVFLLHPKIKSIKESLYAIGATYASMSGSGSSVFALSKKPLKLTDEMQEHFTFQCEL